MELKNIQFTNQNDVTKTLTDYMGDEGLVIFFYPMAKSPGCSIEAQKFEDYIDKIKAKGFNLIGVSKSKNSKNLEFKDSLDLSYDLITDEKMELAEVLNAVRSSFKFMGTKRTTIILNDKYEIVKQWIHASITHNPHDVYEFIAKDLKVTTGK